MPNSPSTDSPPRWEPISARPSEKRGEFELDFAITGTDGIGVILAFAFRPGGTLHDTEMRPGEPDTHFLKSGMGTYQVGQDTIEFGPGSVGPTRVSMAGEDYSWRNGQLRTETVRVYVTGVTPFRQTLRIP